MRALNIEPQTEDSRAIDALAVTRSAPREVLRFQAGHDVELFDRGENAFAAMLDAIEAASSTIHLETYILRADRIGRRILDALARRSRAGVDVRVIFDSVGSRGLTRTALREAEESGVEFAEFNPPSKWIWRFRPRQRDHRKMLLIDGRVAFCGGMNVGDEYADSQSDQGWRDAHMRIEGPVLTELEALFMESWFRSGGSSFEWRALVAAPRASNGDIAAAIVADGPRYRRRRMRALLLDELEAACSQVLIVTPYFAPGIRIMDALAAAAERGVRIKLVLAGRTDHPIHRRAARLVVPRLQRCGVEVYEAEDVMMHAKLACFDERIAIVGTSNLDRQSLHHSNEVNVVLEDPGVVRWVRERFGPGSSGLKALRTRNERATSLIGRLRDRWALFWTEL